MVQLVHNCRRSEVELARVHSSKHNAIINIKVGLRFTNRGCFLARRRGKIFPFEEMVATLDFGVLCHPSCCSKSFSSTVPYSHSVTIVSQPN